MAQLRFFSIHRFEVAGPVLVCDTKHFPRKGCRHMRIQNWGWTHIQLTGKENVSMYYCTVLLYYYIPTLFTLVLYLSMYTRTHPKHTRGTNPFSAISPCITFLVIVVVVVGLVTNSLYDRVHASGVMPIPFSRLLGRLGRLFDLVQSRLLPSRLTHY